MLKLHWDTLDRQTREELLSIACVQVRYQHYDWDDMAKHIRLLIIDSLEKHSHSTVTINA